MSNSLLALNVFGIFTHDRVERVGLNGNFHLKQHVVRNGLDDNYPGNLAHKVIKCIPIVQRRLMQLTNSDNVIK